jgi:hypothetical protein
MSTPNTLTGLENRPETAVDTSDEKTTSHRKAVLNGTPQKSTASPFFSQSP